MEERDKFLTEAMGLCWHENVIDHDRQGPFRALTCGKCNEYLGSSFYYTQINDVRQYNSTFSTWEGFGKLFEWSQKQEWWYKFLESKTPWFKTTHRYSLVPELINPDNFANAVYEFLKERIK